jgi:hypothetical protein
MRFLFVSPEQIVRQKYRRRIVFRLSAVCVFLGLGAQIPIFVSAVLAWKSFTTESERQKALLVEAGNLRKQSAPLEEIRQELSQIRRWEPKEVPEATTLTLGAYGAVNAHEGAN